MYENFLKLVGYDEEEIRREEVRLEKAFKKFGLGPEDFRRAEKRVYELFDTELLGMRKILGIFIREFISLALAREENESIIYSHFPPGPPDFFVAAQLTSEKSYIGNPSEILGVALGTIFEKLPPLLSAAERHGMTPGDAHCARHQTLLGAYALGLIPPSDLSISWTWFCDEAAKADEFVHKIFGLPGKYITIGRPLGDDPQGSKVSSRAFHYLAGEIKNAKANLEEVLGKKCTEEKMLEAIDIKHQYWKTYFKIFRLNAITEPQPCSVSQLFFLFLIGNLCLRNLDRAQEAVEILLEELRQRAQARRGVVPSGAPRVMIPLSSIVDPGVLQLLENQGISIPWVEVNSMIRGEGLKAEDPCEEIALKFFKSPISQNYRTRINSILEECRTWKIDGLFWYNHFSCRPTYTDGLMIIREVKERLQIPAILIEGDAYDPRYYTKEQLRTRIETFAEMLKATKSSQNPNSSKESKT